MHMALAAIHERLAGKINTRGTRRVFRGEKGERTGFDQSDRRARMAMPAGAAAWADYDLLYDRILRLRSMDDLFTSVVDLELDVRRLHEARPRDNDRAYDVGRRSRHGRTDQRRDEPGHCDAGEHDRARRYCSPVG